MILFCWKQVGLHWFLLNLFFTGFNMLWTIYVITFYHILLALYKLHNVTACCFAPAHTTHPPCGALALAWTCICTLHNYLQHVAIKYVIYLWVNNGQLKTSLHELFLNLACAWCLKIAFVQKFYMCVCACVHVPTS